MHRQQSGMTLIELIVALALLALIVGTLGGALGLGVTATASVDSQAHQSETLRIAQTTLRRYVAQAIPAHLRVGQRDQVAFAGGAEALGFTAVMPPYPGEGGVYLVRVALEDTARGPALVLRRQPTAGGQAEFDPARPSDTTVLVENVNALRWSYYGTEAESRRPAWRQAWTAEPRLPQIVRLDLQFRDPAAPAWPPLVIALKLDENPR